MNVLAELAGCSEAFFVLLVACLLCKSLPRQAGAVLVALPERDDDEREARLRNVARARPCFVAASLLHEGTHHFAMAHESSFFVEKAKRADEQQKIALEAIFWEDLS